jgi:Zn-dependent M28 family amino/carboxypeptidase
MVDFATIKGRSSGLSTSSILMLLILLIVSTVADAARPRFDEKRITKHVKVLSSDAFEGRSPGTRSEGKTVQYIIGQMKGAGLSPGGPITGKGKRSWVQEARLLKASLRAVPDFSLTLGGTVTRLAQGVDVAVGAPLTDADRVSLSSVPLIFVGYGISAPELAWDDFKNVDVRGKIIVALINDPDSAGGQGNFGGKAITQYGRSPYKFEEAARRGALGILLIHETEFTASNWDAVQYSFTAPRFELASGEQAKPHAPLEAWIREDVAVRFLKAEGLDLTELKSRAGTRGFSPVPLRTTASALLPTDSEIVVSRNVVGRVPGKERSDETVLYTAHWDAFGVGRPDETGDRIYNGAFDNAVGVGALIELGRHFARLPRLRRSVAFMALTGEEKGLLGSRFYVSNPVYPLARTVGVLNMDGFSVFGRARNFTIGGTPRLDLLDNLISVAIRHSVTYTPDPQPEAGGFFRSDNYPFALAGVPAITFASGDDLIEGGRARSRELFRKYIQGKYHRPSDEWSPEWDLRGVTADLEILYVLGQELASSSAWPNWGLDSEFRATRDRSEADRK